MPKIRLRPSTLLLVVIVAALIHPFNARLPLPEALFLDAAFGAGVLASVLVHELCHAAVARAGGLRVREIELNLWGGHTALLGNRDKPWLDIAISLSGPASNLLIGWACARVGGNFFSLLGFVNLGLGVFNLLPALPLDGGYALRALLRFLRFRDALATRVVAYLGFALAGAIALREALRGLAGNAGFSVFWMLLIAWVIFRGARDALAALRRRERQHGVTAGSLATPVCALPADAPLSRALASPLPVVVLLPQGRIGEVVPAAAAAVPVGERDECQLSQVASVRGNYRVVPAQLAGEELVDAVLDGPAGVLLTAADAAATPDGLITRESLISFLK
ncbi:site-2 protease family protein [Dermabacteraceae bacterium TAE3-ERU27]|nr:site-2 protease family protein [Dermabacteraceae bacterium TAE3-ERU27]